MAYDGIDMAMVQYCIAVVYVVAGASCIVVVDVAATTTLKQTCAQARTRAAAGVLPLLVSPPKSGAQVTFATEGAHVYMRTEEVSLVARHNLVAHVHGQVDRLQCECSLS
jgi:hypothetical protein